MTNILVLPMGRYLSGINASITINKFQDMLANEGYYFVWLRVRLAHFFGQNVIDSYNQGLIDSDSL